jgi:hypothetical protein
MEFGDMSDMIRVLTCLPDGVSATEINEEHRIIVARLLDYRQRVYRDVKLAIRIHELREEKVQELMDPRYGQPKRTQEAIATELHISQATVSRLILAWPPARLHRWISGNSRSSTAIGINPSPIQIKSN